jgi:hypothetical protein
MDCEYILRDGTKLNYNQMREHLLRNYSTLVESGNFGKTQTALPGMGRLSESGKKIRKVFQSMIEGSTKLTKVQKDILKSSPERFYEVMTEKELNDIVSDVIDEIGFDEAVSAAKYDQSDLPAPVRIMILGIAANRYAILSRKSGKISESTEYEVQTYDEFKNLIEKLAVTSTEYGRAINALKYVYSMSGFAIALKLQKAASESQQSTQELVDNLVEAETEKIRTYFEKILLEKVEEGVKEKIEPIFLSLSDKRKSIIQSGYDFISGLRKDIKDFQKGSLTDATLGIPLAILDSGLAMLQLALRAGVRVETAIKLAIDEMTVQSAKQNQVFDKHKEFEDWIRSKKEIKELEDKEREYFDEEYEIGGVTEATEEESVEPIVPEEIIEEIKENINLNVTEKTIKQLLKGYIKTGVIDKKEIEKAAKKQMKFKEPTQEEIDEIIDLSEKLINPKTPNWVKAQIREKIAYIFEKYGQNILYKEISDYAAANQLSGIYNNFINALGFFRPVSTLFTTFIKTKGNKLAFEVFAKELKLATSEAKTIWHGRVSRGMAYQDLLNEFGEHKVRYLEFQDNNENFLRRLTKKMKVVFRALEFADTFSSAASSSLNTFYLIDKKIKVLYPNLSEKQRRAKVFNMMYGIDNIYTEVKNAIIDLKASGIKNPTKAEIQRTIYERVVRKRDLELKKEYDIVYEKLKPNAQAILNSRGIYPGNTKASIRNFERKVHNEISLMIGDYDRVLPEGLYYAQLETGKVSSIGLAGGIAFGMDIVRKKLNESISSKDPIISGAGKISNSSLNIFFPFFANVARWTEMQLELTPYGAFKGAGYKVVSKLRKKGAIGYTGDKLLAERLNNMGNDYMLRSILGAIYGTMITATVIGIKSLIGDDDEEEAVKGQYKDLYTKERIASAGKPSMSIKIGDRNLPLAALGNEGVAIAWWSDFFKKYDTYSLEESKLTALLKATFFTTLNTAWEASVFQQTERYGNIIGNLFDESETKKDKGIAALGSVAGRFAGVLVPANRAQTEIAQVLNPESKVSDNFYINALSQMSIVRAILPGKPNFDYRGRKYDYGDTWVNSPDGMVKFMFNKSKHRDEIDVWLTKLNFAAAEPYRMTKSDELTKYSIPQKNGQGFDEMADDEWYDYRLESAQLFDEYLKLNWKKIDVLFADREEDEKIKLKRELAGELLLEAKNDAISNLLLKKKFSKAEVEIYRGMYKINEKIKEIPAEIQKKMFLSEFKIQKIK